MTKGLIAIVAMTACTGVMEEDPPWRDFPSDDGGIGAMDVSEPPRDATASPDARDAGGVDAPPLDAAADVPSPDTAPPVLPAIDPFADDAELITVERGIAHVEGPTWIPEEGAFVYHTRSGFHRMWRPFEGDTENWVEMPGGNHGSHYIDGYVYLANRRPAEIARVRVSDRRYESLPVELGGETLALPNDIDGFSDGSLYFSDWGGASTPGNYVGFGVYRRHEDGRVDRVIDDLDLPNGVAFSADCRSLYVTDHPDLMRYDVDADGTLSNGRVHFRFNGADGPMNGLAVDARGAVYTVGDRKVTAIDEDGEILGSIDIPGAQPVNLAFGGTDGDVLLITTTDGVLAVRTLVRGAECRGLE